MPRNFLFGKKRKGVKKRGRHAVSKPVEDVVESRSTDSNEAGPAFVALDDSPPTTDYNVASCDIPEDNEPSPETENVHIDEQNIAENLLKDSTAKRKYSLYEDDLSSLPNTQGSYFSIHASFLMNLLSHVCCPTCHESQLSFQEGIKKGMAQYFSLFCQSCDTILWTSATSPHTAKRFDINYRAVLACKETGVSHQKLNRLFSIMNFRSPLHKKSFSDIGIEINRCAVDAAEEVMSKAASLVKDKHTSGEIVPSQHSSTGLDVIAVSFDGTWQKRGHSSHNGVGIAISVDTGLVLDYAVLSDYCHACETGPQPNDTHFSDWYASHKPACQKNHFKSANSMEAEAASLIFSRSVSRRHLIYGTMLCDGDSKALTAANEHSGYDIKIIKEDCINHIAKRMFNGLEACKKANKDALNRKLTQPSIEKITNTYAANLKRAAPDVDKMKFSVLGGMLHMASTDSSPNHRYCPEGPTSWCRHKRAEANDEPQPPHVEPTIKPGVLSFIYPVIQRLTDPGLLKRCAKMQTQNNNECFNSLIWNRCPKTEFACRRNVETATALAVLAFNCGPNGLRYVTRRIGLMWAENTEKDSKQMKARRLMEAAKKSKSLSKWRRKQRKTQRLQQAHNQHTAEGATYEKGAFNC